MLMHISAPLAPHTQCNRRLPFKEIFATTEPMNHKLPVSGCELHTLALWISIYFHFEDHNTVEQELVAGCT